MKKLLILPLLLSAGLARAQAGYTYVAETPTHTGDEMIPGYRTVADTAGKPFSKLYKNSKVTLLGRVGTRWAVVEKLNVQYVIRTSQLPADAQQVVLGVPALKQPTPDPNTGRLTYSEVVQVPGASQAELYTRAKLWFANSFNAANAVAQAVEKDAGVLQGTGFRDIYLKTNDFAFKEKLWCTVKIVLKDGRYLYDVSDLRIEAYPNSYNLVPVTTVPVEGAISTDQKKGIVLTLAKSTGREVAVASDALITGLIQGMNKPATGGKDW